jgi:hypothetical protein
VTRKITKEMRKAARRAPWYIAALQARIRWPWDKFAKCRGQDPELFFPLGYVTAADQEQAAEALSLCAQCDVRAECFRAALEGNIHIGIRAGLTEPDRKIYHLVFNEDREEKAPSILYWVGSSK